MELKIFIAETLVAIQDGVRTAIERTKDTTGAINPCFGATTSGVQQLVQLVEFDLAVTVSDDADGQGAGEIEVLTGKVGGKAKKLKDLPNVNRIQFAIPVLPAIQMMNADESADTGAESLRRASKVASAPSRSESDALQGSGSVASTPMADLPA